MQATITGLVLGARNWQSKDGGAVHFVTRLLVGDEIVEAETEVPTQFLRMDQVQATGDLRQYDRKWFMRDAVVELAPVIASHNEVAASDGALLAGLKAPTSTKGGR